MAQQIRLIVILLFSMELIQAARILQPLSFGIIGENSEENFPEVEKFELNNARQFAESSRAHIFSISSSITPDSDDLKVETATASANEATTAFNDNRTNIKNMSNDVPVENEKFVTEKSFHRDFKTVKPDDFLNANDSEKFKSDGTSTTKNAENSFVELPNDNSVFTSLMPKLSTLTEDKSANYSTETSATKRLNGAAKPTKFIRKVDLASESVVKNVIRPMPPKNVVLEKNSSKIKSIEDQWLDLEKTFRIYTDSVMKKALPKFLRIHSQLNISSQCNAALLQMVTGLRNFKSWAIKSK
ncbi:hypothetical protein AVEN_245492-1 [Araneus ventricosus]|uniref:Uncharacterized protein n=1 Tax=Araneus ventricosus TaxID=182803 RepID=A0A4Y2D7K2_ARAVE|nr:hypothetical protein AVEN_245492-1 [Araneus ventricosus]